MILSKNNLKSILITVIDKSIAILNNLHITKDGSTIVSNGKVTLAVSPVPEKIKESIPLRERGVISSKGVTINGETIKEVLKNIPKDTLFKGLLEYVEFDNGKFFVNDGKRKKTIESKVYDRQFINYRKIFKDINTNNGFRLVVNRKRLHELIKTMDDLCADNSNESPLYIEFTKDNNMLLRSFNYKTGQNVLATMTSYKNLEGEWPVYNKWESKLLGKLKEYLRFNK